MIAFLKKLFGVRATDWKELMKNGAQIIDVRSTAEFQSGHMQGAKNIPLPQLSAQLFAIKKDRPVVVCCASGARSASARTILRANGFANVHNGGGWKDLKRKIS
jgi:rhodanese-related sulfurtransferase